MPFQFPGQLSKPRLAVANDSWGLSVIVRDLVAHTPTYTVLSAQVDDIGWVHDWDESVCVAIRMACL